MSTQSQSKHSALPWSFGYGVISNERDGTLIKADRDNPNTSPCERDDNMRYIVRCVNSHEALVSALQAAQSALVALSEPDEPGDMPEPLLEQISLALEQAGGAQ